MKPSFAIVGCGRVGTALAKFLKEAGYKPSGLASKSLASAKKAGGIIGSNDFGDVPWEMTNKADIVFITTPDGVIEDTCDKIAENKGFRENTVVLHCSGALPSTILKSAKERASIGSMHPLQSFASGESDANPFSGIILSVEGEDKAVDTARKIATDLGATCYTIQTEAKTLYHASAVVASNYLVTLLDLAFRLIAAAGISGPDAIKVLKPLIEGTLSNIENVGISKALTGPIARGDVQTVEKHLDEIKSQAPILLPLYKALGFHTIDIARAMGALSAAAEQKLKSLTDDG
jgi:predicted short-subunit dehydrogenase-like oxidoreductase (DUF2520 family)